MKSLVLCALFATVATTGCDNNNGFEKFEDKNSTNNTEEFPTATGKWREARTFMVKEESDGQDECDQIDFRVNGTNGIYSVNECDHSKTGQLTADEFKRLDSLTTQAYTQTKSMVCPEIFKLNQFYAIINSDDDQLDRHFDPDSSCYEGNENSVTEYKNYLKELLEKYQAVTESE